MNGRSRPARARAAAGIYRAGMAVGPDDTTPVPLPPPAVATAAPASRRCRCPDPDALGTPALPPHPAEHAPRHHRRARRGVQRGHDPVGHPRQRPPGGADRAVGPHPPPAARGGRRHRPGRRTTWSASSGCSFRPWPSTCSAAGTATSACAGSSARPAACPPRIRWVEKAFTRLKDALVVLMPGSNLVCLLAGNAKLAPRRYARPDRRRHRRPPGRVLVPRQGAGGAARRRARLDPALPVVDRGRVRRAHVGPELPAGVAASTPPSRGRERLTSPARSDAR